MHKELFIDHSQHKEEVACTEELDEMHLARWHGWLALHLYLLELLVSMPSLDQHLCSPLGLLQL